MGYFNPRAAVELNTFRLNEPVNIHKFCLIILWKTLLLEFIKLFLIGPKRQQGQTNYFAVQLQMYETIRSEKSLSDNL